LLQHAVLRQRILYGESKLVGRKGFEEKAIGAGAKGLDRHLHRSVTGDHDASDVWIQVFDRAKQLDAAHPRHHDVREEQVERLANRHFDALVGARGGAYAVPGTAEAHRARVDDGSFVIDEEHSLSVGLIRQPSPPLLSRAEATR